MAGRFGEAGDTYRATGSVIKDPYARLFQGNSLLGGANQAGFFNPFGSPQLMEQIRSGAIRNARNQQHKGDLLSRISGLDPSQAQGQMLNFQRQGSADVSNALNQGQLQQLMGNQDFFRQLLGRERGYQQEGDMARLMARLQQQQQGGFGGMLGNLAGIGLGGWAGGGFQGLGRLLGGGGRNSNVNYSGGHSRY